MRRRMANNGRLVENKTDKDAKDKLPFSYPAKDDIYNKAQHVVNIDEDDIPESKTSDERAIYGKDKFSMEDVPGTELDDAQEIVGSEDEENNYYSVGGDRHEDLEENKG